MTASRGTTVKHHAHCPLCSGALARRYSGVRDRLDTSTDAYDVDECRSCGLGLVNPAPSGDLSPFYPDSYLSQEGGSADGAQGLLSRAEQAYRYDQYRFDFRLLERAAGIEIAAAASYLDVGCGSGERVVYAAEHGCPRSVGIDRYRFAKRKPRRNVELVTTEITDYRPAERFQVVSMFHVLEHVEDPVGVLRHLRDAVVSPAGVVVIQVPNYGSVERRLLGSRWFGLDVPRHLFQFDSRTVRDVLRKAGYAVLEVYQENAPLHPVTVVPSLFRSLDVQRIWVRPGSRWSRLVLQGLWAAATIAAVPFGMVLNAMRSASMLTVVARPAHDHQR